MRRWILRLAVIAVGVVALNVAWNVAGSIAITPNSPAPVVRTVVGAR